MASKILGIMKVLVAGFVITAILLLVFAFCVFKFNLGGSQITAGIIAIYALSNLVGGFLLAYREKSKRLIWGVAYGLMYFAILCIASVSVNRGSFVDVQGMLIALCTCVLAGAVGGILVK